MLMASLFTRRAGSRVLFKCFSREVLVCTELSYSTDNWNNSRMNQLFFSPMKRIFSVSCEEGQSVRLRLRRWDEDRFPDSPNWENKSVKRNLLALTPLRASSASLVLCRIRTFRCIQSYISKYFSWG